METLTLVLRLAAPLQSWGSVAPARVRGTEDAPTLSGLLGLVRAAQGGGRDDLGALDELRGLGFTVRVDAPGRRLRDYHTISDTRYGDGKPWADHTILTERFYLTDAVFTVFVTGQHDLVAGVGSALRRPQWPLYLGRKACPPDFPVVLGASTEPIDALIESVPLVHSGPGPLPVMVHYLTGDPGVPGIVPRVVADDPVGPHPFDGYRRSLRWVVPAFAPVVASRGELLLWARDNLDRKVLS